jgi:hypothetical protein
VQRILLVTGTCDAFRPVSDMTIPSLKALADQFGYRFAVEWEMSADSLHPAWAKLPLIVKSLDEEADFVLWVDADIIAVRHDRDIRSEISPSHDLQIVRHDRFEAYTEPHYNTGVMLIRNCDWSKDFFTRAWELRNARDWAVVEESAIHHLLGFHGWVEGKPDEATADTKHLTSLPLEWNSVPGKIVAPDPILHHYAGYSMDERLRFMTRDLSTLRLRLGLTDLRKAVAKDVNDWIADIEDAKRKIA